MKAGIHVGLTLGAAAMSVALGLLPAAGQGLPPSDAAAALSRLADRGGPPAARQPARAAPVSFVLSGVRYETTSGYLSDAELDAIAAPFLGQRMTPARLSALIAAHDAAYAARDVALARASLAGIDPAAGVVRIRLFEARLGQVTATAPGLRDDYLSMRLGLAPGALADTRRIADRLARLALTDGLVGEAVFSPGARTGETDLTVTYPAPEPYAGSLRLDNYGEAAKGEARLLLSFGLTSLTGRNDPLALDLVLSEGLRAATLSHARTVTPDGGRLALALGVERSETLRDPVQTTESRTATLSFATPTALEETRELWLSASLDAFDSRSETFGIASADQSGLVLTLGANGRQVLQQGPFDGIAWAASLTAGRYDDAVTGDSDLRFGLIGADVRADTVLGGWGFLSLSAAAQLALTDDQPSRSAFTVTSPFAVPGYPEGQSQGDGGYWVRAQVEGQAPLPVPGADLRPYAFAAFGEAFDREDGDWTGQGRAAAAGLGLSGPVAGTVFVDLQLTRSLTTVLGAGEDWEIRASLSHDF